LVYAKYKFKCRFCSIFFNFIILYWYTLLAFRRVCCGRQSTCANNPWIQHVMTATPKMVCPAAYFFCLHSWSCTYKYWPTSRLLLLLLLHPHNTLSSAIVHLLYPRTHSHNKHNCNTYLKHNQHVRSRFVSLFPHLSDQSSYWRGLCSIWPPSDHGFGLTRPSSYFFIHTTHSHSYNKHNTFLKQTPSNNSITMSAICSSPMFFSCLHGILLTWSLCSSCPIGYRLTLPSCLLWRCFFIHTTHSHSDNKHNNTFLKSFKQLYPQTNTFKSNQHLRSRFVSLLPVLSDQSSFLLTSWRWSLQHLALILSRLRVSKAVVVLLHPQHTPTHTTNITLSSNKHLQSTSPISVRLPSPAFIGSIELLANFLTWSL
jgi:hypothetical protein